MGVDEFFQEEKTDSEPKQVTGARKRKAVTTTKEDTTDLRQKARLYCKCSEQWRTVSRYNSKRLLEFIEEQEYNNQSTLYESVFGFVHSLIALAMDTVGKGDGNIQTEIESDMSLRQAIEHEGGHFAQLLSNRFRIGLLVAIDTYNGKMKEIKERPPAPIIEEVRDESDDHSQNTELDGDVVQQQTTTHTEEEEEDGHRQV
jgi:hypothetical protein